jgi:drug/metabolite transporter (DMT)-like permease
MKYLNFNPYLYAILDSLIIGFSFLFSKIALNYATPFDILALRFTISFIALSGLILFKKITINYEKKSLLKICAVALFATAFYGLQTFGLVNASSSECGILQPTTPIFTMILSELILKERTTIWQKVSIVFSVIGVMYIFLMQGTGINFSEILGILFVVLSCLSGAFYIVLARSTLKEVPATVVSAASIFIGFLSFNIISVTSHFLKGNFDVFFAPPGNLQFVLSILYLGILSCLATSLLGNFALSKINAAKMSVFGNIRPVTAIFAGVFFLKEQLFYYHIIGTIMIIAGVIGANYTGYGSAKLTREKKV